MTYNPNWSTDAQRTRPNHRPVERKGLIVTLPPIGKGLGDLRGLVRLAITTGRHGIASMTREESRALGEALIAAADEAAG